MTNFKNIETTRDLIFFIAKNGGKYFFNNEEWPSFFKWWRETGCRSTSIRFFDHSIFGKRKILSFNKLSSLEWNNKLQALLELDNKGQPTISVGFKGTLED